MDTDRASASQSHVEAKREAEESSEVKSLESQLNTALGEIIPPEKKSEVFSKVRRFLVSHSGPLPPAFEMAEYEKVLPSSAEHILRMAEKEQDHAHLIERRSLTAEIFLSGLGQFLGWTGLVGMIISGVVVIYLGYPVAGTTVSIAGSLASVIPHFIKGRSILFGSPTQQTPSESPASTSSKPKVKRK